MTSVKAYTINHMKIVIFLVVSALIIVTFKAVRLSSEVKSYKTYWDKRAAQNVPDNAITYVALGDSAAQGIGASSPGKGYVGLLADHIASKSGKPVHVVNLSKSGATIQDVVESQLPALNKLNVSKDSIITLEIGANDAGRGTSPASFNEQADKLFNFLPPQAIVSDLPSFLSTRKRAQEPAVLALNAILQEQAAKHGLKLAPLHQTTKDRNNWSTNAIDFFHPNNSGYNNWYLAFKNAVEAAVY